MTRNALICDETVKDVIMRITIFIFILGGISSDIRLEITLYGSALVSP